jgi:hypothetical protein
MWRSRVALMATHGFSVFGCPGSSFPRSCVAVADLSERVVSGLVLDFGAEGISLQTDRASENGPGKTEPGV